MCDFRLADRDAFLTMPPRDEPAINHYSGSRVEQEGAERTEEKGIQREEKQDLGSPFC